MRWIIFLTVVLPPVFILFMFVLGCSAISPRHEVVRDVNAAWSEDGESLLVVESRYFTSKPDEPHFNTDKGKDWRVVLYQVNAPKKGDSPDLSRREKIGGWKEEANPGGSIMYSPIYWLRKRKRLVAMQNQQPILYDYGSKKLVELTPPDEVKREMVGPRFADGVFGRGATPSPDGKYVGVLYTISYSKKSGIAQLHFLHFMSFFDSDTGRHIRSVSIKWPDDTVDLTITPRAHTLPKRYRFLWSKKSDGVYLASGGRAYFVSLSPKTKVVAAKKIPAHAVATAGGPVSAGGRQIYLAENHGKPNQRKLRVRAIKDWIPFQRVPLVDATKAKYAR